MARDVEFVTLGNFIGHEEPRRFVIAQAGEDGWYVESYEYAYSQGYTLLEVEHVAYPEGEKKITKRRARAHLSAPFMRAARRLTYHITNYDRTGTPT